MHQEKDLAPQQPKTQQAPEKMYALPESLRNSIAEYLASRPYREVAEGLQALGALQQISVADSKDD